MRGAEQRRLTMLKLTKDVFFYHVMKTAGTTVVRLLEQVYGASSYCPLPNHEGGDTAKFRAKVARPEPLIVSGHPDHFFDLWDLAKQRTGARITMTYLRHPVDRFLSCFYFISRSHYVQTHVGAFTADLEAALDSGDPRLSGNMMTKALASLGGERDYTRPAKAKDLALAARNLEALDFVGLVEEFNVSHVMLAWTLGFTPSVITKWNVNRKYPGRDELPRALAKKIMVLNVYDYEIYNLARDLFRARVADIGDALTSLVPDLAISDRVYMVKQHDPSSV